MLENVVFQVIPNLVIPCVRKVSTVRRELVVTGLGARKEHSAMSLDWTTSPTANNALAGITVMSQIWPPQLHSATLGISVLKGLILPSQTVQPTQEMVVFVRWVLNVHKAVETPQVVLQALTRYKLYFQNKSLFYFSKHLFLYDQIWVAVWCISFF